MGNNFTGSIPSQLRALTMLTFLRLSANPALDGSIPDEVGFLASLSLLDFSKTNLTGVIPPSFSNLHALTSVGMSCLLLNARFFKINPT
jgi:hypothetical protein